MPLLDIAIAQSSIQNYWARCRVQSFIFGTVPHHGLLQHDRWASLRKPFQNTGNLNLYLGHISRRSHKEFLVKAVATLEPTPSVKSKDEKKQSSAFSSTAEQPNDSEEIDERERLRRVRISKANKGNTPWNKGRKHSPETLQRIRERTKLAMQDPKVKMKLANIGHAQSAETRKKIAVGVRIGWQRRREKLLLQETCLFDWQNLIAEAGRQGFQEEEELQWDSYKIMNEQLQQEWLASIELRKTTPRPKGSKRAPKSLEQRKKIADAIAAKWADPEYRARVCTGLAKYHGIPEGAERKVRKKSSDGSRSQSPRTPKKKVNSTKVSAATEYKAKPQQPKLKKRTPPKYKDPLANSKLEMLKSIRAQRVASKPRKNEAFERAKLLVAEAEKAAKALEVAAIRSPVARASLIEAKKLIAEAIQSIESIEKRDFTAENHLTSGPQNHAEIDEISVTDHVNDRNSRDVNGINPFAPTTDSRIPDISIYGMPILEEIGVNHNSPRQISGFEFRKHNTKSFVGKSKFREQIDHPHLHGLNGVTRLNGLSSEDHITKQQNHEEQIPNGSAKSRTRKWISGRLVEIVEDE